MADTFERTKKVIFNTKSLRIYFFLLSNANSYHWTTEDRIDIEFRMAFIVDEVFVEWKQTFVPIDFIQYNSSNNILISNFSLVNVHLECSFQIESVWYHKKSALIWNIACSIHFYRKFIFGALDKKCLIRDIKMHIFENNIFWCSNKPASISKTLQCGTSDNLDATTEPPDPPPTTMKS